MAERLGVRIDEPPHPARCRKLVGLDFLADVVQVNVDDTQVTNAGLEHLKRLTKLDWLELRGTQVTDEGVKKLQKALPNCRIIHESTAKGAN